MQRSQKSKRPVGKPDQVEIDQAWCKRSLVEFIRRAWHVLEPGAPYVHGWHIDALAEHLAAVTNGEINRLLINIPPGTMKSMLTGVFWPAWEWGPRGMPHLRVIGASHEEGLAIRDNMKMRRLVASDWYQSRWPIALMGDQNAKTKFENDSTGFRQACAVKSMTGNRGDRVSWDDPHSVEAAISQAHRETALRVFQETLPTRLNSPEHSAIIVTMQRLHESDVSGHIISSDLGYVHLMLPMEFEPARKCKTIIGFEDPRTEEGELLFPARFPRAVVDRDKKVMGSYATAGQLQQRPAPRAGGFFDWASLKIVREIPAGVVKVVRYWDKAGTEGGGAWTAGVKMASLADGRFIVLDVVRGQWEAPSREKAIKQAAALDDVGVDIWIEQEPGSGGKESAQATVKNLAGYTIRSERATGEKALRAEPYSVQVEAGNVLVLDRPWAQDFIDEHKTFPLGKYKDQIDAASGAFNKLARGDIFVG